MDKTNFDFDHLRTSLLDYKMTGALGEIRAAILELLVEVEYLKQRVKQLETDQESAKVVTNDN